MACAQLVSVDNAHNDKISYEVELFNLIWLKLPVHTPSPTEWLF